jgi:hypothetical protein
MLTGTYAAAHIYKREHGSNLTFFSFDLKLMTMDRFVMQFTIQLRSARQAFG